MSFLSHKFQIKFITAIIGFDTIKHISNKHLNPYILKTTAAIEKNSVKNSVVDMYFGMNISKDFLKMF